MLEATEMVLVNGQIRLMFHLSYGVTSAQLIQRISELDICKIQDQDFEKQFHTYSEMADSYSEERIFRYRNFITKHNLEEQFVKEDAEEFKQR
jgi:hypothetical protein